MGYARALLLTVFLLASGAALPGVAGAADGPPAEIQHISTSSQANMAARWRAATDGSGRYVLTETNTSGTEVGAKYVAARDTWRWVRTQLIAKYGDDIAPSTATANYSLSGTGNQTGAARVRDRFCSCPGEFVLTLVSGTTELGGSFYGKEPFAQWLIDRIAVTFPDVVPDTTPPTAPDPVATTAGDGECTVTWGSSTDNVGVSKYTVLRRLSGETTYPFSQDVSASTLSFTQTGLTNGTDYIYTVRAWDAAGNSTWASTEQHCAPQAPPPPPPPPPANGPVVRPAQMMNAGSPNWSTLATDRERFYLMTANVWWVQKAATFKAGHEGTNIAIAYQNGADCRTSKGTLDDGSGGQLPASGVSCQEVDAQKAAGDDWYTHNADGTIKKSNWAMPVMDIGDPDYQRRWADNVIPRLQNYGWDGTFIDDQNIDCNCSGGLPVEYPTTAAWRAAMDSFVAYVSSRLNLAGIQVVTPNIGNWLNDLNRGCTWASNYGGAFEEHFGQFGNFASTRQRLECSTVAGTFFGSTHDSTLVRYTVGVGLLFGQPGHTFIGLAAGDNQGAFQWHAAYDEALAIGDPTGAAFVQADGTWRRNFTGGYVVVNPSTKATTIN